MYISGTVGFTAVVVQSTNWCDLFCLLLVCFWQNGVVGLLEKKLVWLVCLLTSHDFSVVQSVCLKKKGGWFTWKKNWCGWFACLLLMTFQWCDWFALKKSDAVGSLEKRKWCGWFSGFLPCVSNSWAGSSSSAQTCSTGASPSAWTSACTVTFWWPEVKEKVKITQTKRDHLEIIYY